MAALEAEKFIVESQDSEESTLENENQAKKGETKTNGDVPEYRSNPLL